MSGLVQQFENTAIEAGCEVHRTTTEEFEETLADCLESPAVGVTLPFDSISLPESVVTGPTPSELEVALTGITAARFAVADYGSVAIESTPDGEEPVSLWPEHHVAVLPASEVVSDMTRGIERIGGRVRSGGDVVLATGPSATADMGELVVGAHGPQKVSVVVLEDR